MENVIIPDVIWQDIEFLKEDNKKPITKVGRPTVMTNDVLQKLKHGFLMGFDDLEACIYAGVGKSTFYDFQNLNPEFVELKEGWKLNPILKAQTTLYKSLEEAESAKWLLERVKKDKYSIRREITGKDGSSIEMTIEKLENRKTDYDQFAKRAGEDLGVTTEVSG